MEEEEEQGNGGALKGKKQPPVGREEIREGGGKGDTRIQAEEQGEKVGMFHGGVETRRNMETTRRNMACAGARNVTAQR